MQRGFGWALATPFDYRETLNDKLKYHNELEKIWVDVRLVIVEIQHLGCVILVIGTFVTDI